MNIGDKVKLRFRNTTQIGTIIGIWEEDEYIVDLKGNKRLLAKKGDYKVRFDHDDIDSSQTFSKGQLIKCRISTLNS